MALSTRGTRVRSNQLGLEQQDIPTKSPHGDTLDGIHVIALLPTRLGDQGNAQRYRDVWAIFFFGFFLLAPHRLVRSRKGSFSFSIRFIPFSELHGRCQRGRHTGSHDNDGMRWHRTPGWRAPPYIIMRHLHTVAEELGSRCSPLPPPTDVIPLHPGHIGSRTERPSIIPVLVNSLNLKLRKDKSNRLPLLMWLRGWAEAFTLIVTRWVFGVQGQV